MADLKKKATKKAAAGEGLGAGGCKIGVDYGCRADVPAAPIGENIKVDQIDRPGAGSGSGESQVGGTKPPSRSKPMAPKKRKKTG